MTLRTNTGIILAVLLAVVLALLLTGCGKKDASTSPAAPFQAITMSQVTIIGATSESTTVTVNGQPDLDPSPMNYRATLPSGASGTSITISATDMANNTTTQVIDLQFTP